MDDLISRHGVSAWLDNMGHPKLADAILDEKRFAPADTPKGRWIKKRVDGKGIHYGYCSQCGFNVKRRYDYSFCPNCGARMVGDTE